ncbi:MAG: cysteine-rich CWC family protein [Gammaproteobacteria bacterium]|nr:cysteine-rich CWC family protein [Gammaproteobacteria bacterium]
MLLSTIKICPRCQETFECKAGDVESCQCASVKLKSSERANIAGHYDDCLCASCLVQLSAGYSGTLKHKLRP